MYYGDVVELYSLSELPEVNEINEMETYLPEYLIIGGDSGDNVFILRCAKESPVWIVDAGSLRVEDFEQVSSSFESWYSAGCPLPKEPEYHLPLRADIFVDCVCNLKTMFALKKLLLQEWSAIQMKELLSEQPFLAVAHGTPIALERRLEKQPDLKPFVFYGTKENLKRIKS